MFLKLTNTDLYKTIILTGKLCIIILRFNLLCFTSILHVHFGSWLIIIIKITAKLCDTHREVIRTVPFSSNLHKHSALQA